LTFTPLYPRIAPWRSSSRNAESRAFSNYDERIFESRPIVVVDFELQRPGDHNRLWRLGDDDCGVRGSGRYGVDFIESCAKRTVRSGLLHAKTKDEGTRATRTKDLSTDANVQWRAPSPLRLLPYPLSGSLQERNNRPDRAPVLL
jgi:hypothetical protein